MTNTKKETIFFLFDLVQPKTQFRAWEHIKGTFGEDYVTRGTSEVYYSKWKKLKKDSNSANNQQEDVGEG